MRGIWQKTEYKMKEYKKKIRKISTYVISDLDRLKSNNVTIDIGGYLNKRELNYIMSLNLFKKVENSMFGCMVYFER